MSLEHALAANTAALQALTAAIAAMPTGAVGNPQSVAPVPPAPFTAAVAPVPTAPVESTDGAPAPTTAFAQPAAITPPPAAPAAPPTVPPAASGERDSKGMPWDGRIHASSKAKVADGSWRYKRGVDDKVIAPIEAEIRAALGAPAVAVGGAAPAFGAHPFQPASVVAPPAVQTVVAAVPAVAAVPPAPVAPAAVVAPPPAASVAVPVAPVAPVAPAVVVPTANGQTASGITTYEQLMAALPPKIVSGELTAAQMQEACEQYGVPSIAALGQRPDLVPFVVAALRL